MPDNCAEIARLQALLNTGATSIEIDGQQVDFDPVQARKRIAQLRAGDDVNGYPNKHPRAGTINLSGFR